MRLRSLSKGVQISPEITIDTALESHRGIATYFATHKDLGHTLVHILPDFDEMSEKPITTLERAVSFYKDVLHLEAGCGSYEELLYFWEPFPLGEYMFEWLERRERVVRSEAIKRVISLLKTLSEAHEAGLFHGRITPKTVLMERTGDAFGIRLMGLGVSQAMTDSLRFDIDWLDYVFDLEGMTPVAVDIYGVAIILMGLVCGERGIDSFEQSGLLPPPFRDGLLQTAMERALSLRIDAYDSIMAFTLDLEAALLEIDGKEGEMYVGDLVGFESAIRSVTSVTKNPLLEKKDSGMWSSFVDTLETEERSSLLYSLTSLTAVPAIREEDADVTHVSSMPESLVVMRRIHSAHADDSKADSDKKEAPEQKQTTEQEEDSTNRFGLKGDAKSEKSESIDEKFASIVDMEGELELEDDFEDNEHTTIIKASELPSNLVNDEDPVAKKLAEIQSLEAENEEEEGEDESPTRVMNRPNYFSISAARESSANKAVLEVLEDTKSEDSADAEADSEKDEDQEKDSSWKDRILNATVQEATFEIHKDTYYEEEDVDEAVENSSEAAKNASDKENSTGNSNRHKIVANAKNSDTVVQRKSGIMEVRFSKTQWKVLLVMGAVTIILITVAIFKLLG